MSYTECIQHRSRSDRHRSAFSDWRWIVVAASGILLGGCGDERIEHTADGGAGDQGARDAQRDAVPPGDQGRAPDAAQSDAQPSGPQLRIFIEGDTRPATQPFSDGSVGQTPKAYAMGLGRFDLLRRGDDPAPVTVFDHGASPVEVDMLGRTLGGSARLAALPAGTFTHGRVLLTFARATVAATVHAGLAVPGDLTILLALSDGTLDGQPLRQGQAQFTFQVGGIAQTVPGTVPAVPTTPGGQIVQQNGQTWMVFPFPRPLSISPAATRDHSATIHYAVFESFRWRDEEQPGYQRGVFDVDAAAMSYEPLTSFGATGYAITTD